MKEIRELNKDNDEYEEDFVPLSNDRIFLLDEAEQKVLILRAGEDGTLSEEAFPGDRAE